MQRHVEAMRARGHRVHAEPLGAECAHGFFLAPTLIEIDAVGDLEREVFGPVLHVLRFKREALTTLIDEINASGYALTGGAHSRIDSTIDLDLRAARGGQSLCQPQHHRRRRRRAAVRRPWSFRHRARKRAARSI